jgi:hypothetical protein
MSIWFLPRCSWEGRKLNTSNHDIVRTLRRTFVVTTAIRLAPLLNRYLLQAGPPKTIVIPKASQLAKLQEITVRGRLLRNQLAIWDPRFLKHRFSIGKRSGRYELEEDGSLEFCLGVKPLQPHNQLIFDLVLAKHTMIKLLS